MHIDTKYLPKLQTKDGERRKRYLFVTTDCCSRSIHLAVRNDEIEKTATAPLHKAAAAFPFQLIRLLTGKVNCFTPTFAQLCNTLGAQYRRTKPRAPQTNRMAERFNGRITREVLDINVCSHRVLER